MLTETTKSAVCPEIETFSHVLTSISGHGEDGFANYIRMEKNQGSFLFNMPNGGNFWIFKDHDIVYMKTKHNFDRGYKKFNTIYTVCHYRQSTDFYFNTFFLFFFFFQFL